MSFIVKLIGGNYSKKEIKRITPLQTKVLGLREKYEAMTDGELRTCTETFKNQLEIGKTLDDILPEAYAACSEACWRVLSMRPFPVQILGGIVLHQGRISEMKTGEGKTLTETLPAYLNALSGKGVHIVTVNDYLAKRDSEWMGKVFKFMGLSVGLIVHGITTEERRAAYEADITYATNNELGFDYLRDNMVLYKDQKVQRGHNYAIVDEVDSILIDEARTPLIISGRGEKSSEMYQKADKFAKSLKSTKVVEVDSKQETDDVYQGFDYIIDEKAKSATLTKDGVKKAEKFFGIENLADSENMAIAHHINQALKARGIMQCDIDYVVHDNGQIVIVDEFTGRLMIGRRYSEGLHQAIEAKEGVVVEHESKTLATITFQNYFRMYDKLGGMTGTAMTEEGEFRAIYKLDVVEIPTNRPMVRKDNSDLIFKTEKGKFNQVIEQIIECNKLGQPVLVGTISIEKSEELSKLLKKRGIIHQVLNAKHHEKEAQIIAQAGKLYAVTIATNMAGRGTDIVLGGNAEYLAKQELIKLGFSDEMIAESTGFSETEDKDIIEVREKLKELLKKFEDELKSEKQSVKDAGGLFIIGTERHESRRIDNQLRGRAGRQGDPGESRFYISAEDDLMRIFGGERMYNMMNAMKLDEETALENAMLTKIVENAQTKIEGRNFAARKSVLDFDDVINKQREVIYAQRDKVLNNEDVGDSITNMIKDTVEDTCYTYLAGDYADTWNLQGLKDHFAGWLVFGNELDFKGDDLNQINRDDVVKILTDKALEIHDSRVAEFGEELVAEIERYVLLRSVDNHWTEHIDAMDELRRGIFLRAYGQRDPVVEYRNEGYDMFNQLTQAIKDEATKHILTVKISKEQPVQRKSNIMVTAENNPGGGFVGNATQVGKAGAAKKISLNGPCPCGSGKKYKRCCGV